MGTVVGDAGVTTAPGGSTIRMSTLPPEMSPASYTSTLTVCPAYAGGSWKIGIVKEPPTTVVIGVYSAMSLDAPTVQAVHALPAVSRARTAYALCACEF